MPLLRDFYGPFKERVDEKRRELRRSDFTTEETDEVCSLGPPDGHPARAATAGSWRARCTPSTRSRGRCRARSRPRSKGEGRDLPEVRRGHAGVEARPVRALRRLLALPRLRLHQAREVRRRPIRCRSRSSARRTATGTLVARRARRTGNVFWGCSNYPKCDFTTNNEPLGGLHDTDDGPIARKGEAAICLKCGSTIDVAPDDIAPGVRYTGGPPDPSALARPARRPERIERPERPGIRRVGPRSGRFVAQRWRARYRFAAQRLRSNRRRVNGSAGQATDPALQRFLRGLAARDASPNTQRSYATAVGAYLHWLDDRHVDWRRPPRSELRAYLAELSGGHARSSVAQRLAAIRSFHRWAARNELAPGDPWAAIATPRLPRRLPRVLEVEQIERLLAVIDEDLAAGTAGRARAGWPWRWRFATGRSSRPRTPPGSGSASWPLRRSACSSWAAASCGFTARAARSGSGCSDGRRVPRSPPTWRTAARCCSRDGAAPRPRPDRRPSCS